MARTGIGIVSCRKKLFLLDNNALAPHLAILWRRAVAQLGSALEWGSRGRGFESRRPDLGEKRTLMRFLLSSLTALLLAVVAASAQEVEPTPTVPAPQATATPQPTPSTSSAPTFSPTPESQQQEPELLPDSKTLPSTPAETVLPQDLIPQGTKPQIPGSIPNPTSAEQLEKDKIRFRQIRTIAVRNPYAIYFLRRARLERTDEMKREYLRVYYTTMCDQMRKLEPRLKLDDRCLRECKHRPSVAGRLAAYGAGTRHSSL